MEPFVDIEFEDFEMPLWWDDASYITYQCSNLDYQPGDHEMREYELDELVHDAQTAQVEIHMIWNDACPLFGYERFGWTFPDEPEGAQVESALYVPYGGRHTFTNRIWLEMELPF